MSVGLHFYICRDNKYTFSPVQSHLGKILRVEMIWYVKIYGQVVLVHEEMQLSTLLVCNNCHFCHQMEFPDKGILPVVLGVSRP